MPSDETERRRRLRVAQVRKAIGADLRRHRLDAGLPLRRVAAAAGISAGHLCDIENGKAEGSVPALVGICDALGADVALRAYPTSGPRLRDWIQALIGETLLREIHPRWRRLVEVGVHRPARGVIDLVLHDVESLVLIATEIHSQIHRLEQMLRWAQLKAESLPSADFWRFAEPVPTVSRLLVLRSTRATREIAVRFEQTLRAAYPASSHATHDALMSATAPWPGPGILWADVEGDRVRILDRPPRNVALGR